MKQTLYFGGSILTMDRSAPRTEALLVENGKIAALGTREELSAAAPQAIPHDLHGRTLMPAFVDGHSHMSGMGFFLQKCNLVGCTSFDEILERIRKFRFENDLTHGEIIRCRGYDHNMLREGTHPTGKLLDTLGFDNPITCVHQSGHMASYNTAALKLAGIDDSFVCPPGGYVGRDEEGHLNGYFEEEAGFPLNRFYEIYSDEETEAAILRAQEVYLQNGFTTVQEGSMCRTDKIGCYQRLAKSGKLKVDTVVYMDPQMPELWQQQSASFGLGVYHDHLKIGGIKLLLDGSPQAKTAWMRQPYEGETDYRGYPILSDGKVQEFLDNAIAAGIQPLAHCNGDAAAEQFISCWEKAVAKAGHGSELRPVMIHAQTVGYDQLDRMVPIGMMPSFFVGHCYFWGDTHLRNLGERGRRISPIQAAIDRGLPYDLHQDSPVTPPNMLHSIWCAVNRLTRSGVVVGPENRISVYDALIGATSGGAYSYFEEATKGILRAGAVADLIVLDRDPTQIPPETIKDIQVLATIKDGIPLYQKET